MGLNITRALNFNLVFCASCRVGTRWHHLWLICHNNNYTDPHPPPSPPTKLRRANFENSSTTVPNLDSEKASRFEPGHAQLCGNLIFSRSFHYCGLNNGYIRQECRLKCNALFWGFIDPLIGVGGYAAFNFTLLLIDVGNVWQFTNVWFWPQSITTHEMPIQSADFALSFMR